MLATAPAPTTPATGASVAALTPTVRHAPVPVPPRAGGTPSAHAIATRLAVALTDVLAARRSPHQLRSRLTPLTLGLLTRQLSATPLLARTFRVHSVHACPTTRRSIEASAVLTGVTRSRALALRIEHRDEQWICSALSLL
ncbi:hypothetical protein GIY23_18710 [Allosaccharopolyspora coralli]|uniref:Uncharacterized protein n=1 Tax=Allosaccharopolyspora coralli TaxID=2665642 RepID=A0A5Q3Q9X3_9PSEU|nr:Rv3235 family protein [Allosaccharopolyspora coralli]QGK71282.1 hypothetical protein GIY23_18710 [Allosaccharopolyspora coralli]